MKIKKLIKIYQGKLDYITKDLESIMENKEIEVYILFNAEERLMLERAINKRNEQIEIINETIKHLERLVEYEIQIS